MHDFLATDVVALHDAADAHIFGGRDYDDAVYQPVDARLIQDGTLHPQQSALLKVGEYGRMDNGINSFCVLLALKEKFGYGSFVEQVFWLPGSTIADRKISVRANECRQLLADVGRCANQPLGCRIAVVHLNAPCGQPLADITLAGTNAARNAGFHSSSSMT